MAYPGYSAVMLNPHEHDDKLQEPLPQLEAGSAEHLAEYIKDAHQDTHTNPALANLDDYAISAPGILRAQTQ